MTRPVRMGARLWALAVVLAFPLTNTFAADADVRAGSALLERGERAARELDFKTALGLFNEALGAGALTRPEVIRALAGSGVASSALGFKERAATTFSRLLAIEPAWTLPDDASPKVRAPFADGRRLATAAGPSLTLAWDAPTRAMTGAPLEIHLGVRANPLEIAHSTRVRWKSGGAKGELTAGVSATELFSLPPGSVRAPMLELLAEALDDRGSVVGTLPPIQIAVESASVVSDVTPNVTPSGEVAQPLEASSPRSYLLHLTANGFVALIGPALGAEVGVAFTVAPVLDLGVSAVLGASVGVQFSATLRLPPSFLDGRVVPFLQARGVVMPTALGLGAGGGGWVGADVRIGRVSVLTGPAIEGYSAPAAFRAFSVYWLLGLDLGLFGDG